MIFMIKKSSLDSIYLIKRIYRLDQKKNIPVDLSS